MESIQLNKYLEQERLGRLMRKYAIPCILSLLVGALYNIVDQIFIANASCWAPMHLRRWAPPAR